MLDMTKPETLVAQVRDAMFLEIRRHCSIKEKDQKALAERLTETARGIVDSAIVAVVAIKGAWPVLPSKLLRIQDLDRQSLVTLALQGAGVDWTALHRAKLTSVTLVLSDATQFDAERPDAPVERDQRTIFEALDRTEPRREPVPDRFVTVHMDGRPSEIWCDEFNRVIVGPATLVQSVAEYLNEFERRRGALSTREGIDAIVRARYGDVKFMWDNPAPAPAEATGPAPVREPDEDFPLDDGDEDEEGEEDGEELDGKPAEPDPHAFDVVAELTAAGFTVFENKATGVSVLLPGPQARVRLVRTDDGAIVPMVTSILGKRVASDMGHDRLGDLDEYRTFLAIVARANEAAVAAVPVPSAQAVA